MSVTEGRVGTPGRRVSCTCWIACPTWYPTWMRKTSVYLSDEEVARLATLAVRDGTSQAEVIRRAIRGYVSDRRGDRDFALAAVADGPGGSIADVPDARLLDGFGS